MPKADASAKKIAGKHAHDRAEYGSSLPLAGAREAPSAFALQARLETFPADEVVTTVITLEEQMRGWLALIRRVTDVQRQVAYYERLRSLVVFFAAWEVLPFDQHAATTFERLRQQHVRIGTMDLKIAAIALGRQALVLSGNVQDFQQVPGLAVEDWRYLDVLP